MVRIRTLQEVDRRGLNRSGSQVDRERERNEKPKRAVRRQAVAHRAVEEVNRLGLMRIARVTAAWLSARLNVRSERGATAVEYAVMVALIAGVIIVAVVFLGQRASQSFSCVGTAVSAKTGTC